MNMAGLAQSLPSEAVIGLLDALDDVVFFVKDRDGCYVLVNETLVRRVGARDRRELIGRRPDALFPGELGESFRDQDQRVMSTGRPLTDRLELHLYRGRRPGWCRTNKNALREDGRVTGLIGFSRDLNLRQDERAPAGIARALAHIDLNLDRQISVVELAGVAGMAVRTFERGVQSIFGVSAGDLVIKARVEEACRRLSQTSESIGCIALACGYSDHSAFTRQFRARVGVTPRGFRAGK
jgi:PAS domain S-box-containing protein